MSGYILTLLCNLRIRKFAGILFVLTLILCPFKPVSAGEIVVKGDNDFSQTAAREGDDFVSVAAGKDHGMGLRSDGKVVAWEKTEEFANIVQSYLSYDNDYIAIAALGKHSLALRANGTIVGWGENWFGQADSPPGNDYVAIASGFLHSLALRADGSIYAWGNNDYGQLEVPPGNDFVAVAAGVYHSLALRKNGTIVAWGLNNYGQADAPEYNDFVAIACGAYHNLALHADGSLYAWGDNLNGQTELPEDNSGFVDIAGGFGFSMALKSSVPPVLEVSIDIKPGAYPNSVNPKSMGVLPVAILGSDSFNTATVDPQTVTLNGAGIKSAGKQWKLLAEITDVNGDGYDDLLCHIDSSQFSTAPGETVAVLQGVTYDGSSIMGVDTIRIVGR